MEYCKAKYVNSREIFETKYINIAAWFGNDDSSFLCYQVNHKIRSYFNTSDSENDMAPNGSIPTLTKKKAKFTFTGPI